jgi:hypothetical protein
MNRLLARWAALVGMAAGLALTSAGAFAQATITLSDSNCSSFTLSAPPNQVLTCVVSGPPICSVTGPSTGTINSPITLTANCGPAATSWVWVGGNCTTGQSCQDTETQTGTVTYKVTGTNSSGPGPQSAGFPVVWSNTLPAAPSNCSITGAPSGSQQAGVQVTLTINCSAGGAATAWNWTSPSGMSTQTVGPLTVNTTTTFTATASNAGGSSAPASATVQIGGTGPISCPGFSSTLVETMAWDTPGVPYTVAYTYNTGSFAARGALVVQFTTPAVPVPPASGKGNIGTVEYSGGPAVRTGSLSTKPCDFTTGITGLPPGVPSTAFVTEEPTIYFTLGYTKSGYLQLQPNTTYYWNEENTYNGTNTCSLATCDVKITITKQPGT